MMLSMGNLLQGEKNNIYLFVSRHRLIFYMRYTVEVFSNDTQSIHCGKYLG